MRRFLLGAVAILVVGMLAIQLVPYGRDHTEPARDRRAAVGLGRHARTRSQPALDCHSNETVWPWYSNIAPISWRLQRHVDEGRAKLNFSEWGSGKQEAGDIVEVVREGTMPPWDYLILHPEARLSEADKQTLVEAALGKTFVAGESGEGGRRGLKRLLPGRRAAFCGLWPPAFARTLPRIRYPWRTMPAEFIYTTYKLARHYPPDRTVLEDISHLVLPGRQDRRHRAQRRRQVQPAADHGRPRRRLRRRGPPHARLHRRLPEPGAAAGPGQGRQGQRHRRRPRRSRASSTGTTP